MKAVSEMSTAEIKVETILREGFLEAHGIKSETRGPSCPSCHAPAVLEPQDCPDEDCPCWPDGRTG